MTRPQREFDRFARDYDSMLSGHVAPYGFTSSYVDEYKIRRMAEYYGIGEAADQPRTLLNFGCGIGKSEQYLRQYFPATTIYAADVSEQSIAEARERNKGLPDVVFEVFDGVHIPFHAEFDAVVAANVFHHIPRTQHPAVLRSLYGGMRKRGRVFLFEHNPFNPLTRRLVRSCDFDQDAVLLSPGYARRVFQESGFRIERLSYLFFFPEAFTLLLPLEKFLRPLPLGGQYMLIASKA